MKNSTRQIPINSGLFLVALFFSVKCGAMEREGRVKPLLGSAAQISASRLAQVMRSKIYFDDVLQHSEEYLQGVPAELREEIGKAFYRQNYPEFLRLLFRKPLENLSHLYWISSLLINKQGTLLIMGDISRTINVRKIVNGYEIKEPHQILEVPG